MIAVTIGSESTTQTEVGFAAGNQVEHRGTDDSSGDLSVDVVRKLRSEEPLACPQTERDRRVKMTA